VGDQPACAGIGLCGNRPVRESAQVGIGPSGNRLSGKPHSAALGAAAQQKEVSVRTRLRSGFKVQGSSQPPRVGLALESCRRPLPGG
jgi:hypothetical protein